MVINVLLADDHGVLRDGMQRLLEANADIKVVATADDGREAVEKAAEMQPDVVVMDISMPNMNGLEATRRIADRAPATGVAILSMHSSAEMVREAFAAGARGYVLKESAGDEVVRAVRTVAAGRRFVGEGVAHKVLAEDTASGIASLTAREREILPLIVNGKSNAEAAAILRLSPRSVETYRLRLMQKLGIEDLPTLVKFAIRHGMTTLE
ncbi:MAG: response regulator transcription factor [Betaproteobacteria bacterium]|nr:MAG: response regulator transcription factor [Betaproteobacteria bacterium]